MSLGALALVWFVLPRTANSSAGIYVVFGFTGLLGASLGPIINHYMAVSGGSQIIFQALWHHCSSLLRLICLCTDYQEDFSFMGGFLMTGLIVAIVAMLALFVAGFFGVHIPGTQLAISAVVALLMSGFILFDTSRIVNGGERNYIMGHNSTLPRYLQPVQQLATYLWHYGRRLTIVPSPKKCFPKAQQCWAFLFPWMGGMP